MSKKDDLQKIADDIVKNNVCPELRDGATQLVFADGNPDADIVFIGEAPGKNEDEQGKPFVGAAGKFLNEMLESIGMKREDIYITNIVKYRPPNNRDPEPDEKKAFWPYLVRQLDVIQPELVVTLGRHSMEYFLPSQKISAIHGEPKRIRIKRNESGGKMGSQTAGGMQGEAEQQSDAYGQYEERAAEASTQQSTYSLVVLPLFHPAAALYNGGMRQTLLDDFSRIPAILEKI
ncbi:MAG: uracil-DNA glycosylase [Candidatus Saccharimonadales bacterium]